MDEEEYLEIEEVRRKWEEIRRTEELLSEWGEHPLLRYALYAVKGMLVMLIITILVSIVAMQGWV